MHKVVAAATQGREILERYFCEAITGVVMEVVDGEPPRASTQFKRGLGAVAKAIVLTPSRIARQATVQEPRLST